MSQETSKPTGRAALTDAQRALLDQRLRGKDRTTPTPAIPRRVAVRARASLMQERLWFLQQLAPSSPAYNEAFYLRLRGQLSSEALRAALGDLLERHEVLRSRFTLEGDHVYQEPVAAQVVLDVGVLDGAPGSVEREALIAATTRSIATRPFDLADPPLLRAHLLVSSNDDESVLAVCGHHIVADAWSRSVLVRELVVAYLARVGGNPPDWPALPCQFGDYAEWFLATYSGDRLENEVAFWNRTLAGAPPALSLPSAELAHDLDSDAGELHRFTFAPALVQRIERLSRDAHASPFMVLLSGFAILLSRLSGQRTVVVGTPVAGREHEAAQGLIGCFINTVPLRIDVDPAQTFASLVEHVRQVVLAALDHAHVPFATLVDRLGTDRASRRSPIYQTMLSFQSVPRTRMSMPGLDVEASLIPSGTSRLEMTLVVTPEGEGYEAEIEFRRSIYPRALIERWCVELEALLGVFTEAPTRTLSTVDVADHGLRQLVVRDWGRTHAVREQARSLLDAWADAVRVTPDASVIDDGVRSFRYDELDRASSQLAHRILLAGVQRGDRVGICLPRGASLLTALWAVLKCGAAYVPVDVEQPASRAQQILGDAHVRLLVTTSRLANTTFVDRADLLCPDAENARILQMSATAPEVRIGAGDIAYVMFTSGSTGRPKGVAITHGNVLGFFESMDERLGRDPGHWLALTSVAFDISVLELLWTSTRGFRIGAPSTEEGSVARNDAAVRKIDFSLFFFAADAQQTHGENPYRLLLEGAAFADVNGFSAVWTPERHFHQFGGLYPNPAVIGSALAVRTSRLQIRAGSVVAPLHDPLRIAEEWAVVDNLSDGRTAVSFAAGWHVNDFVLRPDAFADRRSIMMRHIEEVRSLWRGESVTRTNGAGVSISVSVQPRPRQQEIPIWITTSGDPTTFALAGKSGANVLTHLLGQSLEQVREKVSLYREARREAGHEGPGAVALMVHAYVGESDEHARAMVEAPMLAYLRTSGELVKALLGGSGAATVDLPEEDIEALLRRAFNRYFVTNGMFGSVDSCLEFVAQARRIGVDDIACLIDFGVSVPDTLAALPRLDEVRRLSQSDVHRRAVDTLGVVESQLDTGITHFQTTPSVLSALLGDAPTMRRLKQLRQLMVGGEASSPALAKQVRTLGVPSLNLYGPTETTVWVSSSRFAEREDGRVTIGTPFANASFYICDADRQLLPPGAVGELFVGGEAVAIGYWGRPDLTAERFVPDPFAGGGARMYRTGDRAMWTEDGEVAYLGRTDRQIKIRGFRIELGEVEASVGSHPDVREAAVIVDSAPSQGPRLVAFVVGRWDDPPTAPELRTFLRALLPEYMVPSLFVPVPELPRTTSNKVDRNALRVPEGEATVRDQPLVEARTELERRIAIIWQRVLDVPRVGIHDDFFAMGGHSLLAAHVTARLSEELHTRVPLRIFVDHPTIAGLAAVLEQHAAQ